LDTDDARGGAGRDRAVTSNTVTLDELLDHLLDLVELAHHEGFDMFAAVLLADHARISTLRKPFERESDPPAGDVLH
jgi:hypothetical protein